MAWVTKVERKKAGPTWTPTAKMRAEYAAEGEYLPAVVPAGPDNPMGLYAMYVGKLYAIHGTNADFGIGLRVSHGCVRLRNEDNETLFHKVPVGTRVEFIINQLNLLKSQMEISILRFISLYQEVNQNLRILIQPSHSHSHKLSYNSSKIQESNQDILKKALDERSGRPIAPKSTRVLTVVINENQSNSVSRFNTDLSAVTN